MSIKLKANLRYNHSGVKTTKNAEASKKTIGFLSPTSQDRNPVLPPIFSPQNNASALSGFTSIRNGRLVVDDARSSLNA